MFSGVTMKLTVNKETALYLLRAMRKEAGVAGLRLAAAELRDPDPSPHERWTRRALSEALPQIPAIEGGMGERPVSICLSDPARRLGSRLIENTVYRLPMPRGSFLDLGNGVAMSSPELLFVELANCLRAAEHLLLGFELCGSFGRDARDPRGGEVAFGLPPLTSVAKLRAYLGSLGRVNGKARARRTLRLLGDNAWSPMEATVVTMMSLQLEEHGYGLGRCILNPRVPTPESLVGSAACASRVPDILVAGTHVGVNYDGEGHLNLGSIVDAAFELGRNPGSGNADRELARAVADVRAKALDDARRNRELLADGYFVFQVMKEDLYDDGGLDGVMMQLLEALRVREKRDTRELQRLLQQRAAARERRALLSRLMPGRVRTVEGEVHEAIVRLRKPYGK